MERLYLNTVSFFMLKILFSVQGQAIRVKNGVQSIRSSDKLTIAS